MVVKLAIIRIVRMGIEGVKGMERRNGNFLSDFYIFEYVFRFFVFLIDKYIGSLIRRYPWQAGLNINYDM